MANELSHYQGIADRLTPILEQEFGQEYSIEIVHNQTGSGCRNLLDMANKIRSTFSLAGQTDFPKIDIDMLIGVYNPRVRDLRFSIVEVKDVKAMNSTHYSQLIGYLQVAQLVSVGLLINVVGPRDAAISAELQSLLSSGQLPLSWKSKYPNQIYDNGEIASSGRVQGFSTGVLSYAPMGAVSFISTPMAWGISDWQDFRMQIIDYWETGASVDPQWD